MCRQSCAAAGRLAQRQSCYAYRELLHDGHGAHELFALKGELGLLGVEGRQGGAVVVKLIVVVLHKGGANRWQQQTRHSVSQAGSGRARARATTRGSAQMGTPPKSMLMLASRRA
jgi:hypothetical protein|tara:strand:+ start:2075 stop:2419 length:345 start_codon:yes stop_codon:yes gene_type:complete